jgi:hypothetical protein
MGRFRAPRRVGRKRPACFVVGPQSIFLLIRFGPPPRIRAFSGPSRGMLKCITCSSSAAKVRAPKSAEPASRSTPASGGPICRAADWHPAWPSRTFDSARACCSGMGRSQALSESPRVSRRHGIEPDARSRGESWVESDPLSRGDNADGSIPCRLRWAGNGMPAALSLLAVVFQTLLRYSALRPRPFRPIVRPLGFQTEPGNTRPRMRPA